MLDPVLWKPRFTVVYNLAKRDTFELKWLMSSRLTRLDISAKGVKDSWIKAGDLYRTADGMQVGQVRTIGWTRSYQVWPKDNFYPYQLRWKPVPWFPRGRVQFWEYVGPVEGEDLIQYMQLDTSSPNSDLAVQLEAIRLRERSQDWLIF
jgi:hypothetical protein